MLLKLCHQFIDLIYPPLCLACEQRTNHSQLLCSSCAEHLTLIDHQQRCQRCFIELNHPGACPSCRKGHLPFKRHAATCEKMGPSLLLLRHFQRGEFGLSKTIASLMILQHAQLNWPLPDWIIPLPTHLFPQLNSTRNLNRWVAEEIGKILDKPCCFPLRKAIDLSYFAQREEEGAPLTFKASSSCGAALTDRTLLLISLAPDLEELKRACEALQESFPLQIFSLSFLSY